MRLEHLLSGALVIRVTFYILYYVVFVYRNKGEPKRLEKFAGLERLD